MPNSYALDKTLSLFIQQAPSAICLLDKEMKYINASKKWLQDYGIENTLIIGKSHYEIFPEIGDEWKELHKRALAGETLRREEDPFPRLDGTIQYIKWEIRPWFDENNEVGGMVMYTEDVTHFVEQRILIENFFNISTELFCILDYDGNFIKINNNWENVLGYSIDELMSKKFFEFMHPDDYQPTIDSMNALQEGTKDFHFINRYFDKNGNIKVIQWNCILDKVHINAIGSDITEKLEKQKSLDESNKLFESFFEISTELLSIANSDGYFVKLNNTWEKVLGYTKEELLQSQFFDFVHEDDKEATLKELIKLSSGETTLNFTNRYRTKSGTYKYLNWRAEPYGQFINSIATDITEELKVKQLLEESQERFITSMEGSLEATYFLECAYDTSNEVIDFIIKEVNRKACEQVSMNREQLINQNLCELFPFVVTNGFFEKYKNCFYNQIVFEDEYFVEEGQNGTGWYHLQVIPIKNGVAVYNKNISDTKKSIIELQETKDVLEETNRVARIGYWEVDLVKNHIFWSKITKEIHGVDEDFDPNLNTAIQFFKEGYSRDKINELVNNAIQNGIAYDEELQLITLNSHKEIWVRAIGRAQYQDGKVIKLYGSLQDINQRKVLEQKLEEDRQRLNQIIEGTNVGTWEWNVQTGHTIYNQRWAEIIGYTLAELEPIDINTWTDYIHPEDNLLSNIELEKHFAGLTDFYECKSRMKHKNGNWVWVLDRGKVFTWTEDGKPEMMYGTHQEITQEVELQNKITDLNQNLTSIMDSTTQVSIIATDLDGVITHFNKGAENLLGYKADEMIGVRTPAIIHLEDEIISRSIKLKEDFGIDVKGFEVFVAKAKMGKYDVNEWSYVRKDGSLFKVQLVITAQYNILGEIIGFIGVATDITKIKRYEIELIKAKEKAEETSRAKSDFLANMSHEIRTPLNGVIGFTDLLMRSNLDDLQKQYMDSVNKSAISLMDLINDILDFSKIESGKLELNIEKIDIYDTTSQVVDVIKFKAHEKQLEIILDIDYSIGRYLYLDPVRLRQILINLMGNAVKFTEKGEISLSVKKLKSYFELDSSGSQVQYLDLLFSIKDTGIGIDNNKFGQIVEAFGQEDSSTTRKYGGTGLGLSITNKLLLLMGSHIEISSEIGKGSDFYFILKVRGEKGYKEELVNKTNYKNALVIDDNQYNRIIIVQMLKLINIECKEAENGIEGLKQISNTHFDIIIIDYNMPYMDGIEVIRNIREKLHLDSKQMPIIFLHSSSDSQLIESACIKYNVNNTMIKPIKFDWLLKTINDIYESGTKEVTLGIENQVQIIKSNLLQNIEEKSLNKKTIKILIVEDNDVNLLLAKSIFNLILSNCQIFEARNGKEALDKVEDINPDIIFMDVQMPIMNGYDSSKAIRQLPSCKNIPIIALTAGTVKGERERCLEAGMSDYITKPVVADKIQEMLVKWLSKENMEVKEIPKDKIVNNLRFNKQSLFERVFNDTDSYKMIVNVMLEFLENEFKVEFERSIKQKDNEGLDFIIHKLKGSAATCSMKNLFNFSLAMEKTQIDDSAEFKEKVQNLLEEINEVIKLLQEK